MDGWAAIEPAPQATTESRPGYQYYMAVIGGDFIHPLNFVPQGIKLDEQTGEPVKSRYPSATQPFWLIDLGPPGSTGTDTVTSRKVETWKTPTNRLSQLGQTDRSAVNALKKWFNSTDCALWYHNANSDHCSLFGGPHLHVVFSSAKRTDGGWQILTNTSLYSAASRAIKSTPGYLRVQRVRHLPAAMRYFNTPPRVFMGSRSLQLGRLLKQATSDKSPRSLDSPMDDAWWDDDTDTGDLSPAPSKRRDDFALDDNEPDTPPAQKKSRSSDFDHETVTVLDDPEDTVPGDQPLHRQSSSVGNSEIVPTKMKETSNDRLCGIIEYIMTYLHAYEYEEILRKAGQLDIDNNIRVCWTRLIKRPGTIANIGRIRDTLKITYQGLNFTEMAAKFLECQESNDPQYYGIGHSLQLLDEWCTFNRLTFHDFTSAVRDTMNMKHQKINTLLLLGGSNSGKSMMLKRTLEPLVPFNAQIGGVGNSSAFMWMNCPGARAVFIEECMLAPEHIETAKLIFGGEPACVDVKLRPPAKVGRVPVFVTSNNEPWRMAQSAVDKEALQNRMTIFRVHANDSLKHSTKNLNPGMWWYISKAHDVAAEDHEVTLEDTYKHNFSVRTIVNLDID
nr:MAG: nonstructural protein [Parvoviridae sp.]